MVKKDSTAYSAERVVWDTKDCAVRALAVATGVPYTVASVTFSAQGRRIKRGTDQETSTKLYETVLGMRRVELAEGLRLGAFLEVARTGSFIVHKKGHAFAVVEGVVHDWEGKTTRDNTTIVRCWKVTEVARGKMEKMQELLEGL